MRSYGQSPGGRLTAAVLLAGLLVSAVLLGTLAPAGAKCVLAESHRPLLA